MATKSNCRLSWAPKTRRAVDISKLRGETGYITLDEGYVNTGATLSAITFLDGEKGILRYRGYPVEQLAEKCDFVEVAYLLIYGELPTAEQLEDFREKLRRHTMLHEDMRLFYDGFPRDAHPMAILSSVCGALSTFYQDSLSSKDPEQVDKSILRLIAKLPTIAAYAYKKSIGQPFVYPQNDLTYCENFLRMMFAVPSEPYEADPDFVDALNLLLIVHADHEQNCSTSTVRMVGSSRREFVCVDLGRHLRAVGPAARRGERGLRRDAQQIASDGGDVKKYVDMAKDKNSGFRLMGFGHRVYKNFDPRATIIKKACDKLLAKRRHQRPDLRDRPGARGSRRCKDEYFIERKLYPNVDFYSGVIYRAIGIPVQMFTVLFAMGRLPGWIAHWMEMRRSPTKKICRPRQIYTGPKKRDFVPMDKRG